MRESGVQIEALVEYVALFQEGEHTAAARLEILEEQRAKLVAKLEEMQATAKRLDAKDRQLPAGRRMLGRRRRMAAQGIASSFPHTLLPTRKERPPPDAPFNTSREAVDTTRCDPSPRVVSPFP